MTYVFLLLLVPLLLGLVLWLGDSRKLVWQEPFTYPRLPPKPKPWEVKPEPLPAPKGKPEEIASTAYERFILCQGLSLEQVYQTLTEYGTLAGEDEPEIFEFGFGQHPEWSVIRLAPELDTHTYHDLVSWLKHEAKEQDAASHILGYARHQHDSGLDYVVRLDERHPSGAMMEGGMQNGRAFIQDLGYPEDTSEVVRFVDKTAASSSEGGLEAVYTFEQASQMLAVTHTRWTQVTALKWQVQPVSITPMW
ncbi:MAG: hypothetical protein AAFR61_31360 [Bacteroidota bacterium]